MTAAQPPRLGAHPERGGVSFAALAECERCRLELVGDDGAVLHEQPLEPVGDGYYHAFVPGVGDGARYWFVVDDERLPDPYARALPQGVHGPAQVVASSYVFRHGLPRRPLSQQVIYELHVGTFTEEGTFEAARRRLSELAGLGITTLELMPLAAFAGERGWGYDGVALFAPHAAYGTPDELRALVDEAHGFGLGVLLDVVYNHFGPDGNYLSAYFPRYFSETLENAWGKAPSFAEPALRRLVLENARYWLTEFRFDGLRLDATHAIVDPSPRHVLSELAELTRRLEPPRLLIAEDERNLAELVGDVGLDALWADDFHHQLRVTFTGERHGYYAAYEPSLPALADVINRGWLYRGQSSPLTGKPRGSSADDLPAEALVYCIQNHDQVGNRALGERFPAGEAFRAASLLLLFLPMTPLLFMGQEWGASSPFLYFTDHEPELGRKVTEGRRREFAGFPEFAAAERQHEIPDPQALDTFLKSKLRWSERAEAEHAQLLELYRAALALRRHDAVLAGSGRGELLARAEGGVISVLRWRGDERRLLLLNAGDQELPLTSVIERTGVTSPRVLLQSSRSAASGVLPASSAVVLAGRGKPERGS